MPFTPHTQSELKAMGIAENSTYRVEYLNRDYFNGEQTKEVSEAQALLQGGEFIFVVTDPLGMDKIVKEVRIL